MLLIALSRSGYALGALRGTEAAMRDRVLVAMLTALLPSDHSFSTLSQNLRNFALDYGTGVPVLSAAAKIPLCSQHAYLVGARLAAAIIIDDFE
jgi:hypothetical protein